MSWVKFDDDFLRHPKVLLAGRDARDFHIAAIFHCSKNLTDGFVMLPALTLIASEAGVTTSKAGIKALALRLVDAGLWHLADGGYEIHDYLKYQPSKETALALRQIRAEAGARGGKRSGETRREVGANGQPKHEANASAKTNPVPVSRTVKEKASDKKDGGAGEDTVPPEGSDFDFIQKTLAEKSWWREPLEEKVRKRKPDHANAYRATVLQGWIDGNGTPPEPPATLSLSEDWRKGDLVEVRSGVFAEATHDKNACRLPLASLRYPGAKYSAQEVRDMNKMPEWNGRRPDLTEWKTSFPVPGWFCKTDKNHYTIGDDGYDSPPRRCDREGNLLPDDGDATTVVPVVSAPSSTSSVRGVMQC